jgi:glutathione synthase/RimK-type ligase-like ATP-grasp enzyme
MKLILANNQTNRFIDFYKDLQQKSGESFDYFGYDSLLFVCGASKEGPIQVYCDKGNKSLADYDGVYINGYLKTYELAVSVAIACQAIGIGYVNKELSNPPSLSKLSMYSKLSVAGVPIPASLMGSKKALIESGRWINDFKYPAVLKRADADRGIDNYKVSSPKEVQKFLAPHQELSIWVLQEFVENKGFYLISFYNQKPAFCIYRSLEKRPDKNANKAHMYKPVGGSNAQLIDLKNVPEILLDTCKQAVQAMNRQIGSVDCLYNPDTQKAVVLEVNYNPQLVTIETFKEVRIKAFLDNLSELGN